MTKPVAQSLFTLLLFVFILAAFLGVGYAGMAENAAGEMAGCPFMGVPSFCEMNFLVHIAKWQGLFSVLLQREASAFFLALLVSVSMLFVLWRVSRVQRASFVLSHSFAHTALSLFVSSLQEAFSDGILHPKIF